MHYRDRRSYGMSPDSRAVAASFGHGRKFGGFILFTVLAWSLLAFGVYVIVDPIVGWLTGSAGSLVDGGKNLATVLGAGNELTNAVTAFNPGGWLAGGVTLLGQIAKPAIIGIWGIGVIALLLLPKVLRSVLGR